MLVLISRHRVVTGAVLIMAMIVAWFVMPAALRDRYATLSDAGNQATWIARQQMREMGKRMFFDHPAFGVGAENFEDARATLYDGIRLSPHNVYIGVAAELGVAGLIPFFALIFFVVRENHRLRRRLRAAAPTPDVGYALALSLAAELSWYTLLVVGITGHNLYNPSYYLVAALTVCLSHYASRVPPAEEAARAAAKG